MDLDKFRTTAARKKKSLKVFLDKLDVLVPEDMPELVAKTDGEVWQEINCMECANCCKTMTPVYTTEDIKRIAAHLRISPAQFKKQYIVKEADSGNWVNSIQPCHFLVDNKCSIYEVRPVDCAEFPHHNKKPFDAYNDTFKANIIHCPATLMLVDKLKKAVEKNYEW